MKILLFAGLIGLLFIAQAAYAYEVLSNAHTGNVKPVKKVVWVEELSAKSVSIIEKINIGMWIPCPICGVRFARRDYGSHEKCHVTRERFYEYMTGEALKQ